MVSAQSGGTLQVRGFGSLLDGVRLEVPPGALGRDSQISIWLQFGDPRLPSPVQTFTIEPPDLPLVADARLTLAYDTAYELATKSLLPEDRIEAFSWTARGFGFHPAVARSRSANSLTIDIDLPGTFVAIHPSVHALILQEPRLLDPAEPVDTDLVQGIPFAARNGPYPIRVGKGSLDRSWSSPPDANLLVLHGLMMSPFHLQVSGSLVPPIPAAGFNGDFANIVVYQYPSGLGIAENANRLYEQIRANHRPGFGCNVVAQGSGGLVVRYALEQSHSDPSRAGFLTNDPPLASLVSRVVFLGTPHQGAWRARDMFADLLGQIRPEDERFVRGILDILPGLGGFTSQLNHGWTRPETRYYAVAGDAAGDRSDGLVDVLSAVGVPTDLLRPEAFQVFSGPLYNHLSLTALADDTGVLDQARVWLDKVNGNSTPTVGSVRTPRELVRDRVEIPFSVSDPEGDPCSVAIQFSTDGRHWAAATDVTSGRVSKTLPSRAAPGLEQMFVWDTRADGVGIGLRARVVVRFIPTDASGVGTPGVTGMFYVQN
jgi:hypothetical protein